jgi:hypothetical protein
MNYHNIRCALCGRDVAEVDRDALLELDRYEWDDALVEEYLADMHVCDDSDPLGVRAWARLSDAGMLRQTLQEAISLALERRRPAGRPPWAVFTGYTTLITPLAPCTRVPGRRVALAHCHPARGP